MTNTPVHHRLRLVQCRSPRRVVKRVTGEEVEEAATRKRNNNISNKHNWQSYEERPKKKHGAFDLVFGVLYLPIVAVCEQVKRTKENEKITFGSDIFVSYFFVGGISKHHHSFVERTKRNNSLSLADTIQYYQL